MFEALLEQMVWDADPSDQIHWTSSGPGIRVCQFDCVFPAQARLAPLGADQLEILFWLGGGLQLFAGGQRAARLRQRELLVLSPAAEYSGLCPTGGRLQGCLVVISAARSRDSLIQLCRLLGLLPLDLGQTEQLLRRQGGSLTVQSQPWSCAVFSVLEQLPPEQRSQYCALKSIEVLYLLCRDSPLLSQTPVRSYYDRYQVDTIRQMHDYMLEHLEEHLTIQRLSQQFHLSPTLLKDCFRQTYGEPVHSYLRRNRLQKAAHLLTDTALPVIQIAASVGYGSVSQFGSAFKSRYQVSPARYRRLEHKKNV